MRQFGKHIALFFLPIVAILSFWAFSLPPAHYRHTMLQKDCRSGNWIERRLASTTAIDVAFIGTSKTMCDVNDGLVEQILRDSLNGNLHLANLGICRTGENLHYLILRELLATKKPKIVFIELSNQPFNNSHHAFPHFASLKDGIEAPIWPNVDYFSDLQAIGWNHLVWKREKFWGIERKFADFLSDSLHSFMKVDNDMVEDADVMEKFRKKRENRYDSQAPEGFSGLIWNQNARISRHYFRLMAEACKSAGATPVFLYLPMYGASTENPKDHEFYSQLAPMITPPDSILKNPKFYFDHSHLNQAGAAALAPWLAAQIAQLSQK